MEYRLQFSLRMLLKIIFVLAIIFAIYGAIYRDSQLRQRYVMKRSFHQWYSVYTVIEKHSSKDSQVLYALIIPGSSFNSSPHFSVDAENVTVRPELVLCSHQWIQCNRIRIDVPERCKFYLYVPPWPPQPITESELESSSSSSRNVVGSLQEMVLSDAAIERLTASGQSIAVESEEWKQHVEPEVLKQAKRWKRTTMFWEFPADEDNPGAGVE